MNQKINALFKKITELLNHQSNEDMANCVISQLESIAGEFNLDQFCEAKTFQYRWQELKPTIKEMALTDFFSKLTSNLEIKLEQVLEPEKWEDCAEIRKNGQVEQTIDEAIKFFNSI